MPAKKQKADTKEKYQKEFQDHTDEYQYVEGLVKAYQKQFEEGASDETVREGKTAAGSLITKFQPLLKKYFNLIRTGQIDFEDDESKKFVLGFIGDPSLKAALKRKKQKAEYRHPILQRFNFVRETYGSQDEEEIMTDLAMLLLTLARRYRQVGKNFCAYLYNCYCYEVSRHIKKFIRNPANIHYRSVEYEDYMQTGSPAEIEECFEDRIFQTSMGIPDMTWVNGTACSEIFQCLSGFERQLLVKYYLEEYNDRQIGRQLGLHINTVNQKRRKAIMKLAEARGMDITGLKRSRKSGKKALLK